MEYTSRFNFGIVVRDVITGFSGIVTGHCRYITGCDQYLVSGKSKKGEKPLTMWYDENRLERVGTKQVVLPEVEEVVERRYGADIPAPIK
jgi:hypothetical protein